MRTDNSRSMTKQEWQTLKSYYRKIARFTPRVMTLSVIGTHWSLERQIIEQVYSEDN